MLRSVSIKTYSLWCTKIVKGERRDKRKRSFLIWQCRVASYFRDSKDNPRWEHATLSSVKNSIKRENPKKIDTAPQVPGGKLKVKKIRKAVVAPYVKSILCFGSIEGICWILAGSNPLALTSVIAGSVTLGVLAQGIYNKLVSAGNVKGMYNEMEYVDKIDSWIYPIKWRKIEKLIIDNIQLNINAIMKNREHGLKDITKKLDMQKDRFYLVIESIGQQLIQQNKVRICKDGRVVIINEQI